MALPDALHVLRVDEVVASLPHDVHRRQVHVVANSEKGGGGVENVSAWANAEHLPSAEHLVCFLWPDS